jgi:hypothetical protein
MPQIRSRHAGPAGAALLAAFACAGAAAAGQTYLVTVNTAASSTTASATANAPFTGTMTGENDTTRPATEQTRLKRMANIFSCGTFTPTTNDLVNISGAIGASGNSSGSTLRPAGTFRLGIDTAAGTASVSKLNANLISSGSLSVAANLNNFTYQSFCAVNPSCTAPFLIPISFPLGNVTVTGLTAAQDPGAVAVGTLTPGSTPGTYTYSVPVTVTVTPAATFNGGALDTGAQTVQATVTGTVTPGSPATVTASVSVDTGSQTNTTPTVLPASPTAFPSTSPICANINIIVSVTLTSTAFQSTASTSIAGSGPRVPCPVDFNGNFAVDLIDLFDFLTAWFANAPAADYNGAGGVEILDIFDYITAWFSPPPGC